MMTDEMIQPIFPTKMPRPPKGRPADRVAMGAASLGAVLSIITAIWFFAGFAENDTRPEHLASAFVLTTGLFAFAIIPFTLVAMFARKAYRSGTKRSHLFWTVFLMLPWLILGKLAITHAPLPVLSGLVMTILAGLLTLWAVISLVLEKRASSIKTPISQQYEMRGSDS